VLLPRWLRDSLLLLLLLLLLFCRPHQGLILDVSPLQWQQLEVLPTPEELQQQEQQQQQQEQQLPAGLGHPVWLALDEVVDPVSGCLVSSSGSSGGGGINSITSHKQWYYQQHSRSTSRVAVMVAQLQCDWPAVGGKAI
jgi:hypothetical protein